jgi:hypothetical protein
MNRYQTIPVVVVALQNDSTNKNNESSFPRKYATVKYPQITLDSSDIYLYTTRGDRYDTLALSYYGDTSLWWIIALANSEQIPDSLIPTFGAQIRVPGADRIASILSQYENLNRLR